jgi:aspartokinase-like uncharacterized kinase
MNGAQEDSRIVPALTGLYRQAAKRDLSDRFTSCSRVATALSILGDPTARVALLQLANEERDRITKELGELPTQETVGLLLKEQAMLLEKRDKEDHGWTATHEQRLNAIAAKRIDWNRALILLETVAGLARGEDPLKVLNKEGQEELKQRRQERSMDPATGYSR